MVSAAEVTFKHHSRSPAISPFDRPYTTYEFLISIPLQLCPYLVQHCLAILTSFFFRLGTLVWPIALNSAWTERHCHACKTPRSMYPSIYNSFPVIRTTIANKKLTCRREAARCFVFVCSQLQHTYSAVFTARCICISAVYAVTQCPSVCHVRELRRNE